ncbi:ArgP/LysG family DNA-binding transcriptional regulator [Rhizobium sp. FKY42]|uniref:ArgP/LysG family DNA-binding transcriptional regulator n=1 Tax=Rhizobium sp. FKY42 TaxID=2562310 RepID=UPI0010C11C7A|nr:ArgP/LysG family DNA-binding transcriptional regulator [Rhizobium sp. FKY42]
MLDYDHLEALVAVTRERSFDGAARSLGLTSSAVSQRIKRLEERIGAIVVNRNFPLTPTVVGAMLCRHAEVVQLLESEILSADDWAGGASTSPYTKIKVLVNDASLCSWFIEALAQDAETSNQNLFELVIVGPGEAEANLRCGSALAALSFTEVPIQGFRSRYLGAHEFRATASRRFIDRYFSAGVTPETLAAAPALRHSSQDDLQQQWAQQVFGHAAQQQCHHTIPSSYGCVAASLRGIAWGVHPSSMVDHLIESGELLELVKGKTLKKNLYWHYSLLIANALEGFTRNVRKAAMNHLDQRVEIDNTICGLRAARNMPLMKQDAPVAHLTE